MKPVDVTVRLPAGPDQWEELPTGMLADVCGLWYVDALGNKSLMGWALVWQLAYGSACEPDATDRMARLLRLMFRAAIDAAIQNSPLVARVVKDTGVWRVDVKTRWGSFSVGHRYMRGIDPRLHRLAAIHDLVVVAERARREGREVMIDRHCRPAYRAAVVSQVGADMN